MNSNRPELGAKVRVRRVVLPFREGKKRTWTSQKRIVEGIYVGWRTLMDTEVYGYWDEEWYPLQPSIPGTAREVWLIVFHPRRNQIRAFPEDVEVVDG